MLQRNRNTAVLRDASGGEEQFDFESTDNNPTTYRGRNEELLTYEETAGTDKVEATFTFSRRVPQEDYDSDAFDGEGIKRPLRRLGLMDEGTRIW